MPAFAYYLSSFPLLTTTFIQREVAAFRAAGVEIRIVANSRPRPGEFHESDIPYLNSTLYLSGLGFHRFVQSHVQIMLGTPVAYFRTLCLMVRTAGWSVGQWSRSVKYFVLGGVLATICSRERLAHLHVHFAFGAAGAALFCKSFGGPSYSITVHGSDVLLSKDIVAAKLFGAAFVVSNCRFHIDNLRERFPALQTKRFHLVRIGLNPHEPRWCPAPFPEPRMPLRIVSVGRLIPVKAHHLLIDACAEAGRNGIELRCRIIGDGPLRGELKSRILRQGLDREIEMLGALDEESVARHMSWAHVIALSSLSEGTPMVLIEAMAKARPVIAPNITGIPEVVEQDKTGFLFEKGSVPGLVRSIRKSAEFVSSDLPSMGQAGRRRVEVMFDIALNVAKRVEILTSALGSRPGLVGVTGVDR